TNARFVRTERGREVKSRCSYYSTLEAPTSVQAVTQHGHDDTHREHAGAEEPEVAEHAEEGRVARERRAAGDRDEPHGDETDRAGEHGEHDPVDEAGNDPLVPVVGEVTQPY